MNKYIKLDGIKKLINACEWRMTLAKERHGEGFVDYSKQVLDADELTKRISDLPTIEVSEDYIDRKKLLKQIEDQYGNMWLFVDIIRKAPSIVSDEDCISRKYMFEKAQEWKNMYPDSDTAREALTMLMNEIDNAPSVAPRKEVMENVN